MLGIPNERKATNRYVAANTAHGLSYTYTVSTTLSCTTISKRGVIGSELRMLSSLNSSYPPQMRPTTTAPQAIKKGITPLKSPMIIGFYNAAQGRLLQCPNVEERRHITTCIPHAKPRGIHLSVVRHRRERQHFVRPAAAIRTALPATASADTEPLTNGL